MPELPEVQTIVNDLSKVVLHKKNQKSRDSLVQNFKMFFPKFSGNSGRQ